MLFYMKGNRQINGRCAVVNRFFSFFVPRLEYVQVPCVWQAHCLFDSEGICQYWQEINHLPVDVMRLSLKIIEVGL